MVWCVVVADARPRGVLARGVLGALNDLFWNMAPWAAYKAPSTRLSCLACCRKPLADSHACVYACTFGGAGTARRSVRVTLRSTCWR